MRIDGFNKKTGIFIITYHILLVIAWFFYFSLCTSSLGVIISSIVLFFLTGLSITGGYHRYYSHSTYKTNYAVEAVLLFFGSMAAQASALRWSFEHRLHHAYVDTDNDPYSVKRGFWYAHILWLFKKPAPIDKKVVPDLFKNPLVMFQHNHYLACMLTSNVIAFVTVGYFFNDWLGAFVLAWWTRLFCLHHSTWFINSLAHYWGAQSFNREQTAVDNYIISFLTFGEGYHNYHHTFANDYRNGIRWYHFDPTKWLIWGLHAVGLAHSLKRVNNYH
ncbi:MAG: putative fatty-acid desaturase, partial [Chlamydiia bacterium]|nr:putative fatty-acid desaturase [Chlamydiia bacterium]